MTNTMSGANNSALRVDEKLRVILWDIDGTLLRSARPDSFKEYAVPALEKVFGTSGRLRDMTVSGMTDWQIVIEALQSAGLTFEQVRERALELRKVYTRDFEQVIKSSREALFYALPGVRAALQTIAAHARYHNALLTGNVRPAAYLKVRAVDLANFFRLPGAFGDDNYDRRQLPALAARRISRRLRVQLHPTQFIIIGDTPNDIKCAKHFGARVIAVATGRSHTPDQLRAHNPDALLADLSDMQLLLRTLDRL